MDTSGSEPGPAPRRSRIVALLAGEALTLAVLRARLSPAPSSRQLSADLAWLRSAFPGRLRPERIGRALAWRFVGEPPRILAHQIPALDEDQIAALIAARGILRQPDPTRPAAEDPGEAWHGSLAQAIDRLLHGCGLGAEARAISPDAISISRFGATPEEDAVFPILLAAIRSGRGVGFAYANLAGVRHPVHARPVRLVHIAGEWHLLAWAADARRPPGILKQYRLSRIQAPAIREAAPDGCPEVGLRAEAVALLRDAFRATGSTRPADRRQVVLAISPEAWPFCERRRWGDRQHEDPAPADLPPGWRRLRFTTTGLAECRHWVLAFGAAVRAEGPPELLAWLREQARQVYERTPNVMLQSNP